MDWWIMVWNPKAKVLFYTTIPIFEGPLSFSLVPWFRSLVVITAVFRRKWVRNTSEMLLTRWNESTLLAACPCSTLCTTYQKKLNEYVNIQFMRHTQPVNAVLGHIRALLWKLYNIHNQGRPGRRRRPRQSNNLVPFKVILFKYFLA
jgi:hypothetical protein